MNETRVTHYICQELLLAFGQNATKNNKTLAQNMWVLERIEAFVFVLHHKIYKR